MMLNFASLSRNLLRGGGGNGFGEQGEEGESKDRRELEMDLTLIAAVLVAMAPQG